MSYIEEDLYQEVKEEVRDNMEFSSMSDFMKKLISNYFAGDESLDSEKKADIKRSLDRIKNMVDNL